MSLHVSAVMGRKNRSTYLLSAAVIFALELVIAFGGVSHAFVRGSLGDLLVIALLYALLRGVAGTRPGVAACVALAAGVGAETLQYFHVGEMMGIENESPLYILLGSTFSAADLLMYFTGALVSFSADRYLILRSARA